jgi:hypothetical protein
MDDIERMIRDMPERRHQAEKAPEPVRSVLAWLLDQQERQLLDKRPHRGRPGNSAVIPGVGLEPTT